MPLKISPVACLLLAVAALIPIAHSSLSVAANSPPAKPAASAAPPKPTAPSTSPAVPNPPATLPSAAPAAPVPAPQPTPPPPPPVTPPAPVAPRPPAVKPGLPGVTPAVAQGLSPQDDVPRAGLVVLSALGVDAVTENQAIHDAGKVSVVDTPTFSQTFVIVNNSDSPILIDRMVPSCRCTSAVAGRIGELSIKDNSNPSGVIPGLAPNDRLPIKVTTNLAGLPDGPLLKRILIYVRGKDLPAAELLMKATVGPTMTFDKNVLEFGRIAAGQPSSLPLTVTVDSRLIGFAGVPKLATSSPDLKVEPGTVSSTVAPKGFASLTRIHYLVSVLPTAPDGGLEARLSFAPLKNPEPKDYAWQSSFVTVTGNVVGTITATPATAVFNNTPSGQPATVELILHMNVITALDGVAISTNRKWLSAKILPTFGKKNPADEARLEVGIDGSLPPGFADGIVTLSLASGERFPIPVSASIAAKLPAAAPVPDPAK